MNADFEKLKIFFVKIFLFIDRSQIEIFTSLNLTQTEYLVLMVGVWIVIAFLTWFFLWMVFKVVTCWK